MKVVPGIGCLSLPVAGGAGFENALVAEATAERGGRGGDPERVLTGVYTDAGGELQDTGARAGGPAGAAVLKKRLEDTGARAGGHSVDRSCA